MIIYENIIFLQIIFRSFFYIFVSHVYLVNLLMI